MRLLEFQAKRLLAEASLPTPPSVLITSIDGLADVTWPKVLKAQVPVGGRGKAGAIRRAETIQEAREIAGELLAMTIKSHPVSALLAEEPAEVEKELYLALLIDKDAGLPLIMASEAGGVDIEAVAKETPERIHRQHIDPALGLRDYNIRAAAKALNISDAKAVGRVIRKMLKLYEEHHATLIEINPLAVTPAGLVALDAKIILDDKAAFLHKDMYDRLEAEQKELERSDKSPAERKAEEIRLNYVPLAGDVGVIADGAGTGMLTLDLIQDAGGRPANFCEMGGLANTEVMHKTLEAVLADKRLKVLLISLIGGLTRMDEMAEGIAGYLDDNKNTVPLVVRMCGTKAEVGIPLLESKGVPVFEDLVQAVRTAVETARSR